MKKRYTLEQKRWDSPAEHPMPEHTRVPASFTIGNVHIAPATVLAPMAGVTDTVFRRFIKNASMFSLGSSGTANVETTTSNEQSGCGLIMTEFTSADGLSRMRESKRKRYLTYYDDEHPISAQLFGSNPETLADSARICEESGFDVVDLNLGCPAKRVVACNGGSGLLRDLPLIEVIFKAVRAAVSIPFTVKFRMGWNDRNIVCVELAKLAEDCGLNAVALHARTREDGYTGQARWEYIAAVKDAVSLPVIGNGDIRTPEDAAAMVDATHCDAVMIGRAAPANPWIFRQIAQYTASKEATGTGTYDVPTDSDRYLMIKTYFQMLVHEIELEEQAEASRAASIIASGQTAREQRHRDCVGKMKQFASWFTHGVPGGSGLRKSIFDAKNGPAVLDSVEAFFKRKNERDASVEEHIPSLCPPGAALDRASRMLSAHPILVGRPRCNDSLEDFSQAKPFKSKDRQMNKLQTLAIVTLASLSTFGIAQTAPAPGTVTPSPSTTQQDGAPLTKSQMKEQKKQQKHEEKAAKEAAKAQKSNADALKHQDRAKDEQEKVKPQQPQ